MSAGRGSGRERDRDALFRRTMDRAGELAARRRRRQRLLVTAPAIVLVLALTAGVLAAVVVSSGTPTHHLGAAGRHLPTTVPSSTTPTSTTTAPSTTLPPPRSNANAIKGFDPVSFTAVSLDQWWVLGYVPAARPHLTIAQTVDGGSRFSLLGVPDGLAPNSNGTLEIRFADPNDGYLVGGSSLWATTDDGASWVAQAIAGSVTALEVADGKAFAIDCGSSSCSLFEEAVGSGGSGSWHVVLLPERLSSEAWLSVVGGRIVVTNGVSHTGGVWFVISTDGGATFTKRSTPCYRGLGGHVFAAAMSPSALWAACPTGMLATPFRSSDNGSSWSLATNRHQGTEFSNGLSIAPISASTALVWPHASSGGLALTTNGGQSFTSVLDRGAGATILWAGYSDSERAYAIFATGTYAGQLWISSDGGRTWSEVHFDR
jgi:photosystem II stability/assembly factor-like uncharacterized protein